MTAKTPIRALFLLAALSAVAQGPLLQTTPTQTDPLKPKKPRTPRPLRSDIPSFNPNLIVLDAAHGGQDNGAKLGENSFEKDATVALAALLKTRLERQGFTVVLTHAAAADDTPQSTRIELANRSHAAACLLLHASNGGHGVHLYTSALAPSRTSPSPDETAEIVPWDTAQASVLPQSVRLAGDLATAINGLRVPLVIGQSSVRPMDSITCPVVALELAPLDSTPASDPGYQTRVSDSVASALVSWRGRIVALNAATATGSSASAAGAATPNAPRPSPRLKPAPAPRPAQIPDEVPLEPPSQTAPAKPSPPKSKPPAAALPPPSRGAQ